MLTKLGWIMIWFAIIIGSLWWTGVIGATTPRVAEESALNRLRTRALVEHESRAEDADNTQNLIDATRKTHDNNIQLRHDLDQIQNGVKNCPASEGWENGRMDVGLMDCKAGTPIWVLLPEPFKEVKFKASLYKKGEGGRLVQLAIKPVIEVINPNDGFSQAVEISPAGSVSPVDYKVRGRVGFTTLGADADVLVLELIP